MNKNKNHEEFDILGTWEIHSCEANEEAYDNLKGVRFTLDEGDDITWHLTAKAEQETLPLFSCRTFELDDWSEGRVLHFFMSNAGDWIEFKVSTQRGNTDQIILKSGKSLKLTCNKIRESNPSPVSRFSLLDALNEGYFSDLKITACSGEEFAVHKTVLSCLCSSEDWTTVPTYMRNLPCDVLKVLLNYLYTGCLPDNLSESAVRATLKSIELVPCFKDLVKLCRDYLEATAVITSITSLLNDIEKSMDYVMATLNTLCSANNDGMMHLSVSTEPSQIFEVSKLVVQQIAIVCMKFVLLCDVFCKRKNELTRQERHNLIKVIRDRIPIYANKLHAVLVLCQDCLVLLSMTQKKDIALYFVPKIEEFIQTVSEIGLIETLEEIIQHEENEQKKSRHSSFGDKLSKTLKKAVHIRELKVLRMIQEETASFLSFLFQRREDFCDLSSDAKVRSMVKGMNKMIEGELPDLIESVEKVPQTYTRLKFKDWKSLVKVGTAQISWILETVKRNKTTVRPVCDFIKQYEPMKALMVDLGLTEDGPPVPPFKPEYLTSTKMPTYRTNHSSKLSQAAFALLESGKHTDMTFTVRNSPQTFTEQCCQTGAQASICEENKDKGKAVEFKAHRVIVAARCNWFRCALLSGMKESIDRTILVPDTSPAVFQKFLKMLYLETMDIKSLCLDEIVEMMALADIYEINTMKEACESSLCTELNTDNVLYILSIADRYNTLKLKDECFKFIASNEEVLKSDEVNNLTRELQQQLDLKVESLLHDVLAQSDHLIDKQLEEYGIQSLQECTTRKIFEQHAMRRHRATRVEKCMQSLSEILGDSIPRRELIRITLAADCDVHRALNFYFSWQSHETR